MYADIYIYGTTPVAYNPGKEVWLTEYYIVHQMQIYAKVSCTANPTPGVYVTVYKSGGKLMIVAINQNSSGIKQAFRSSFRDNKA